MDHNLVDSKYRKVVVASQRARQLQRGARPRVQIESLKATRIAIEEVDCRLVIFELLAIPRKPIPAASSDLA